MPATDQSIYGALVQGIGIHGGGISRSWRHYPGFPRHDAGSIQPLLSRRPGIYRTPLRYQAAGATAGGTPAVHMS